MEKKREKKREKRGPRKNIKKNPKDTSEKQKDLILIYEAEDESQSLESCNEDIR